MVNTTVMYDGQQIQINLPDNPSLEMIYKCLHEQMPRTFDFRTHIFQLFDPTIGEFFDLNDDGLKSWFCLPFKEKNHMRLQIIRAGIDYDHTNGHDNHSNDNMSEVFQKIERDIETLFGAIENLQATANGIRQDFKSALDKYHKYQGEKISSKKSTIPPPPPIQTNSVSREKIPATNVDRPMRYPAEDIRFKNQPQKVVPIPVIQQVAPLVSNAYQDDDDDDEEEEEQSEQNNHLPVIPPIDIETPLLNVGEDFQALVSIAVNPSYFFVQNTLHTHDLEKLAQSMNDYYSATDPPSIPFKPIEMSCCAARYSVDNRWYRARIKRYSSEATVELVYLDYGNNEERNVNELRPLDPAFARLPAQAICAALELLPVNGDNNSSWTKKASFKFHEDTLTKPLDVRIIAQPTLQWPMYFVQLTIDEHTDVAETLITLRHGRRASLAEIVQIVAPRLDLNDYAAYNLPKEILQHATNPALPQRQPTNVPNLIKQDSGARNTSNLSGRTSSRATSLPSINLNLTDNIGSCTITSITSPSHFFIQLTEKNHFEQIYNGVNATYLEQISCDRMSRLKNFSINTLGVARNNRDQRFYRVQIINHDRERRTLLVLCFDFGEYITIQESSLYELVPEYQIYPPQAIKCSLALINSVNDDWSREAINLMNRFIGGKGFKTFRFYSFSTSTRTIKLGDLPLPIILYDMNTSVNSVNEQLVEKKLATADSTYMEYIRLANDAMNDLNGYKNQRIRQYIESQRNYTQPQQPPPPPTTTTTATTSSVFIERNPIDVRYEQPQKQQIDNPTNIEPLPLPEDEDNLPYCPPVVEPEPRHWYAVEVTHVKSAGEFYIRYPYGIDTSLGQGNEPAPYPDEIEPNQMLNDLHRNMADLYATEQRRGISTAASYCRGQMVAVRYQSHWYRARVLEFKPTTNFAWVQFVDQGEIRELGTNTMRPLHTRFLDLPLQAYLCRLDGFDSNHPWTTQDKDLFKKKIRDKILYARKTREPNFIQLVEFVDRELVSFDSFWNTLHHSNKASETPTKPINRNIPSNPRYPSQVLLPTTNHEAPVRNLQPVLPGILGYGSGSEYSQTSSMMPKPSTMKKSSGVTIPPPPLPPSANKQPMQFVSAGFKQPVDYTHLSPSEQLAQLQQQESHRIQPTTGYSINKHFRQQQYVSELEEHSSRSGRSMLSLLEIKSKFGAEFRRFELDRKNPIKFDDFNKLIEELHALQNIPFHITYLDKDGELLSINNDTIIEHILRVNTGLLRVFVQRKGESYQYASDSLRKRKKISDQLSSLIHPSSDKNNASPQRNIELQPDFRLVSSIIDVEILPVSYRRVKLHRYKESKPLGFYIRDGVAIKYGPNGVENVPGVFISRLLAGGLAESTGLLSVGDEIIEVNGIEVSGKTLDQVTDMMVANSHNLIITVRPQNDTYNLKRTGSSSTIPTKSPISSLRQTNTSHNGSQLNGGMSDDEDGELYRSHDTHNDSHLQKTPSVLKL